MGSSKTYSASSRKRKQQLGEQRQGSSRKELNLVFRAMRTWGSVFPVSPSPPTYWARTLRTEGAFNHFPPKRQMEGTTGGLCPSALQAMQGSLLL